MNLYDFWSKLPPKTNVHPDDAAFLSASRNTFKTEWRPATPFDGPIYSAKVVICYANPFFTEQDRNYIETIANQLKGTEPLPEIPHWLDWYEPRLRTIGRPLSELRSIVSIFNICPYASNNMTGPDLRVAAGLPSVWTAQKHLREILIPTAQKGEIFLVIARKHQLWGITDGFNCPTIGITRNIGGYLSEGGLGLAIGKWLSQREKAPL